MYTLFVAVQIRPERRARFLAAITENAAASVRDEPGCLRFDVMEDAQRPGHFYFYEIYRDPAAFDAHRDTPHYAVWQRHAEECLMPGSKVNTFSDMIATNSDGALA
ncbi:putative quinol monooxygenase [Nocardia testacea]|uniref:Quinol monooxygenase n=1 Tax=Nocardia testacea TaxID=248551 RepID=A0ABW7VRP4_9NOCA